MKFSAGFDWQITIAIVLFLVSFFSKYWGSFQLKSRSLPYWSIPFALLILYCTTIGFISLIGALFLVLMLAASLCVDMQKSALIRWTAGVLSVLLFLGLGFHAIPGFDNQLYIDSQQLKGNSTPYTSYINFDKTIGGLIFFLVLVPSPKLPPLKRIGQAVGITFLTSAIVLTGGKFAGLVEFNFDYYFGIELVVFFIMMQIFSTTLAEETFFRGFIQNRMYSLFKEGTVYQNTIPLIFTAVLFGVVHFAGGIGYVIASTFAGIGYGLVYQITRRIEAVMIAHMTLNVIHLLVFTYPFKVVA